MLHARSLKERATPLGLLRREDNPIQGRGFEVEFSFKTGEVSCDALFH
jgi:hypothetical protein